MMKIDKNLNKKIKEVEEKLESLRIAGELTSDVALSRANEIAKIINNIIEIGIKNPAEFYEKAVMAYLLAAEKVRIKERDMVAFPSNYWSMRADEERFTKRKSLVAAQKEISKSSPSLVSGVKIPHTCVPTLEIKRRKEIKESGILEGIIKPYKSFPERDQTYQTMKKEGLIPGLKLKVPAKHALLGIKIEKTSGIPEGIIKPYKSFPERDRTYQTMKNEGLIPGLKLKVPAKQALPGIKIEVERYKPWFEKTQKEIKCQQTKYQPKL